MKNSSTEITYESVTGRNMKALQFSYEELARLSSERILITGAGGSIGSRITYFLNQVPGVTLLATDRDETSLHSLSLLLSDTALFDSKSMSLMDIKDIESVESVIAEYQPSLVIHAAALKHLSTLEKQPLEAIKTNIYGTANVIESSSNNNVKRFVNISTDKAVNPKSVLGLSKRVAEIYTNSMKASMHVNSVRFGNVFNSRGSVIETFFHQMTRNTPVTLTSSEITRYFMHIDEASHLVIKSLLLPKFDLYTFDMGEPIPLTEIIQNMMRITESSSPIVITGIREGEKLDESLHNIGESVSSTSQEKVFGVDLNIPSDLEEAIKVLVLERNSTELMKLFSGDRSKLFRDSDFI